MKFKFANLLFLNNLTFEISKKEGEISDIRSCRDNWI